MGAAVPVLGVVSAVSSIAQRRADISAQNRAATLQAEANARAAQIRQMGVNLQMQQLEEQTELDKMQAMAQFQQANYIYDLQAIQRKLVASQQLAGIDAQASERLFAAMTQQYQAMRTAYAERQQVAQQTIADTAQQAQAFSEASAATNQIAAALKQGDMQLAAMYSRNVGEALDSSSTRALNDSMLRQQDYEAMRQALLAQSEAVRAGENIDFISQYGDLLNRAIEAALASSTVSSATAQAATQQSADAASSALRQQVSGADEVDALQRALLPTQLDIALRQADMNRRYGQAALENERFAIRGELGRQNAALMSQIRRPSLLSDLAVLGTASVPLYSHMRTQMANRPAPIQETLYSGFPDLSNYG